MPTRFRTRAPAKINLGLKILGPRPDGFHELRTIFQSIALADRLELEIGRGRGVRLAIEGDAPAGAANLAYRAAEQAADAFGLRGRITVKLTKRIPLGAGLGGGSSDAAAVLRMLAQARSARPRPAQLLTLAAALGSDVAPFLVGGTVLGLGRGQEVYALPGLGPWPCVLAMPRQGPGRAISTPQAFAAWDRRRALASHPGLTHPTDSATMVEFCSLVQQVLPAFRLRRNRGAPLTSFTEAGGSKVHAGIENDFQAEVFSLSPDFPRIHQHLRRAGAVWVSLTGSGAAQFGLFSEAETAAHAAARLALSFRCWRTRFLGRRAAVAVEVLG